MSPAGAPLLDERGRDASDHPCEVERSELARADTRVGTGVVVEGEGAKDPLPERSIGFEHDPSHQPVAPPEIEGNG
jgi:hypothetical protein